MTLSVPLSLDAFKMDLSSLAVDALGRPPLAYGPRLPHYAYVPFAEALARASPAYSDHPLFSVSPSSLFDFPAEAQNGAALPALYDRYCRAACRNYIAIVPNRGHRIGAFALAWVSAFALARQYNLTLLHTELTPNQPERYLFERLLGFGANEPFKYRDICLAGFNGRPCRAFLPCLEVDLVSEGALEGGHASLPRLVDAAAGKCNHVMHLGERPHAHREDEGMWEELRSRYSEARKQVRGEIGRL